MIRTKLHVLASNVDLANGMVGKDSQIVKDMMSAASFVVDKDVLALVQREDCKKSVSALIEARMVRLPYNPMVIEFEVDGKSHEFCYLREIEGGIVGQPIIMDLATEAAMVANFEIKAIIEDGVLMVHAGVYGDKRNTPETKIFLHTFAVAVHLALLMLNTKGIEKEEVQVSEHLNRKRAAKGKPAIPHHSVVHIGTIYRRDGTGIKYDGGRGGWHMPMHWRCGYTRRQHFGKGREEEKIVYIPPCIVNFKPEEKTPHAPMRKVKV